MTRLFEHQGKRLLKELGVSIPAGDVATTPIQARRIAEMLSKPVAIKAQVGITGRLKAGGIRFASSPDETERIAAEILGQNIKGFTVENVLVEEKLQVETEYYIGVIVDDSYKVKGPTLIFSTAGGIVIEEVAARNSEKVAKTNIPPLEGITLRDAESLVGSLGLPSNLVQSLGKMAYAVYQAFKRYDARSVEVNPVVLTSEGIVYAADCRIALDESSIFKHPELGIVFPRDLGRPPTRLERISWAIEENDYRGISYFAQMREKTELDGGYIGFHGIGGGAAMLGADALLRHGLKIANYADTSGNPTATKVYRTIKVIFSQPDIEGYILMGAVIANQEQWHHANALVKALREELADKPNFPVILLLAGNKEIESLEILKEGLKNIPAKVEIYGRDYVYNVDYIAQRMRQLVEEYRLHKDME